MESIAKCPFLEEILVQYCTACDIKKMLPSDRLISASPCAGDYHNCPAYLDFYNKKKKRMIQDMAGKENDEQQKQEPAPQ